MPEMKITDVRFSAASPVDVEGGLLGWASCAVNRTLRLDGLALRRTLRGDLRISFPCRRDAADREHFYIRPIDNRARRDIERQVFQALGMEDSVA